MNDTRERYGVITRLFHWVMAVLVVWQGLKFFDRINDGEHWVGQTLVSFHGKIGSLILFLVILRIIWAYTQRNNRPIQDPATVLLVKLGHFVLYACMILMPITGVMFLVGLGYGWNFFGLQLISAGPKIPWMASFAGSVHSPLAWIFLIMVIGHVGMALFHHFVKKDGVMKRMM